MFRAFYSKPYNSMPLTKYDRAKRGSIFQAPESTRGFYVSRHKGKRLASQRLNPLYDFARMVKIGIYSYYKGK